eukprot:1389920-Amphidinium_carterae.1
MQSKRRAVLCLMWGLRRALLQDLASMVHSSKSCRFVSDLCERKLSSFPSLPFKQEANAIHL